MHENWMVIYDKVYDLTKFFYEHPGGSEVLMENGGRDASFQFLSVGHSDDALKMLEDYLIGILPEEDRMWSNHGSLATSIR
jgi:cytochrome b involved in lipid metabolism